MANRVVFGQYANHLVTGGTSGSPTTKYGVFISKPGVNVLTAKADELIFNTDTNSLTAVKGMFQLAQANTTAGTQTVSTTITSGSSATISVPTTSFNFGFGFLGFGNFGMSTGAVVGADFNSGLSYTSNANNTITVNNTGDTTETAQVFILPKFSNVAFF